MISFYFLIFLLTGFLSFLLTAVFKVIAFKIGAVDYPEERKIHKLPTARLGGVALFISYFTVVFFLVPFEKHILGLFLAALLLLILGIFDDIKGLKPQTKLLGQVLAALIVIASGIGISFITNPFGGFVFLDSLKIPVTLFGQTFHITFWADLFTIIWIIILTNAINFLDGLDGLASGVSGIAALAIFFLSLHPDVAQPQTALLALVLAGAIFGFLPLNFYPAKIFMGDSGSLFLGFVLAVLAIFSGGKIATALLILGLPVLDALWAALRRILAGKSPFKADKKHLHHILLEKGLSQKQVVLLIYLIVFVFGLSALLFRTFYKFIALLFLLIFVLALILFLYFLDTKRPFKKSIDK